MSTYTTCALTCLTCTTSTYTQKDMYTYRHVHIHTHKKTSAHTDMYTYRDVQKEMCLSNVSCDGSMSDFFAFAARSDKRNKGSRILLFDKSGIVEKGDRQIRGMQHCEQLDFA